MKRFVVHAVMTAVIVLGVIFVANKIPFTQGLVQKALNG